MSDLRKINTERAYELGLDLMVDTLTEDEVLVPVEPDLDAMVDALNGLTAEDLPHVEWHRGAAKLLWEAAIGRAGEADDE